MRERNKAPAYHIKTKIKGAKIEQSITCETADGLIQDVTRNVMDTAERQIHDALVKLGWTPPSGTPK